MVIIKILSLWACISSCAGTMRIVAKTLPAVLDFFQKDTEYIRKTASALNITNLQLTFESNGTSTSFPTNFLNSEAIWSLNFSNATFEKLAAGDLEKADLSNLEILDLQFTNIREIEKGAFLRGIKIKQLSLSHNNLEALNLEVFIDLPELEKLSLNDNPFVDLGSNSSFPKLNLTYLNLKNTSISGSIPINLFKNLKQLETVDFSSNQIQIINSETFSMSVKLKVVDLSNNNIQRIANDTFPSGTDLKLLNLSSNNIQTVNGQLIPRGLKLSILNLSNNKITSIGMDTFPRGMKLKILNLSRNQLNLEMIMKKGKNPFENLEDLIHLDLSYNNRTSLDVRMLQPLKNLETINLYGNPWHCDCNLKILLKYLTKNIIKYANHHLQSPMCYSQPTKCNLKNNPTFCLLGKVLNHLDFNKLICLPTDKDDATAIKPIPNSLLFLFFLLIIILLYI